MKFSSRNIKPYLAEPDKHTDNWLDRKIGEARIKKTNVVAHLQKSGVEFKTIETRRDKLGRVYAKRKGVSRDVTKGVRQEIIKKERKVKVVIEKGEGGPDKYGKYWKHITGYYAIDTTTVSAWSIIEASVKHFCAV